MHFGITFRGLAGQKKFRIIFIRFKQLVNVIPIVYLKQMPVVQPCSFQLPVIRRKAQRADQVQMAACYCTQTNYIAGVGRNLRLV